MGRVRARGKGAILGKNQGGNDDRDTHTPHAAGRPGGRAVRGRPRAGRDWPNRPVRVIVPYPPAGGADTTARILYAKLGDDPAASNSSSRIAAAPAAPSAKRWSRRPSPTATPSCTTPPRSRSIRALSEAAVRLQQGFRAGVPGVAGAEHPGGDAVGAGEDGRRRHRLCQGAARRHRHGLVRQRHAAASLPRDVPLHDRHQDQPRALSRRRRSRSTT